jgi:hypothetical protein
MWMGAVSLKRDTPVSANVTTTPRPSASVSVRLTKALLDEPVDPPCHPGPGAVRLIRELGHSQRTAGQRQLSQNVIVA